MTKHVLIYLVIIFTLSSCFSTKPGWNTQTTSSKQGDVNALLKKAHQLEDNAATSSQVMELINAFKDIESIDPDNYYALWKIGNYHILMGAAHSKSKKEKKQHYKQAIMYCEKAMATNKDFYDKVTKGATLIDAAQALTINETDAMGYWYTARFYYFKDCLSPMGRIFNTKVVIENNKMIELIDMLDPTWAGGGNYFSRGLYYIAVPERFGGSKLIADEEFNKAVEVGPHYIVNRWGRAKYLYSLVENKDGFVDDLNWVISQDPHSAGNPYPWNVYFQNDAKKMLSTFANSDNNAKQ